MTNQEFRKAIIKANWYDKYYYSLVSFAVIGVGIFFLYLAFFNKPKQSSAYSQILIFCAALLFIFLGSISLYLIPNRYKFCTINCQLSTDEKKKIIADTMKEFGALFLDNPENFWTFNYQRRWCTFDYNVYLTLDNEKILIAVVSVTLGRGGFIDFGQTERFRKKLNTIITKKISQK